jgi:hypothetical protein
MYATVFTLFMCLLGVFGQIDPYMLYGGGLGMYGGKSIYV